MAYKAGRYTKLFLQQQSAEKRNEEADEATAGFFERSILGKKNMDILNTGLAVRATVQEFRDRAITGKLDEKGYYMGADGTVTQETIYSRNKGGKTDWLFGWESDPTMQLDKLSADGESFKTLLKDTDGKPLSKDQYKEFLRFQGGQIGAKDPTSGKVFEDPTVVMSNELTDSLTPEELKLQSMTTTELEYMNPNLIHNLKPEDKVEDFSTDPDLDAALDELENSFSNEDVTAIDYDEKLDDFLKYEIGGSTLPNVIDKQFGDVMRQQGGETIDKFTQEMTDLYGMSDDLSSADQVEIIAGQDPANINSLDALMNEKFPQKEGGTKLESIEGMRSEDEYGAAYDAIADRQDASEQELLDENTIEQNGYYVDSRTGEIVGEIENYEGPTDLPEQDDYDKAGNEIETLESELEVEDAEYAEREALIAADEEGAGGKDFDIERAEEQARISGITTEDTEMIFDPNKQMMVPYSEYKKNTGGLIDKGLEFLKKDATKEVEVLESAEKMRVNADGIAKIETAELRRPSGDSNYNIQKVPGPTGEPYKEEFDALLDTNEPRPLLDNRGALHDYAAQGQPAGTYSAVTAQKDTKLFKKALGQLRNLFGGG